MLVKANVDIGAHMRLYPRQTETYDRDTEGLETFK